MLASLKVLAGAALVLTFAIICLRLIFPLPSLGGRASSAAIPASVETALGKSLLALTSGHPGESGLRLLQDGREAFAARILLARAARASIDAQYYIWQRDATGLLLLDELRMAALRGVRVRLLVDDNGVRDLDADLAALAATPNVEVRLFNPFTLRRPKALSYLFDFPRLNRRMHNKSFTVDGVATILGGRNIGDIYFAFGPDRHFIDTDVLALGPAARDVSTVFDRYWMSRSAFPAETILSVGAADPERLAREARQAAQSPEGAAYGRAAAETPLVRSLLDGTLALHWARTQLISDDPAKGVGAAAQKDLLLGQLLPILRQPGESLDLVSAYFIPGKLGLPQLTELARRGVRVRVVTNALESTDVSLVHAGYARYRPALIEAGIQLYELRAESAADSPEPRLAGLSGSSQTSLHSKTFAVDQKRLFVGSFNFDPRSVNLNTEMGLLIESPDLAAMVAAGLDEQLARNAYRVEAGADGALRWATLDADGRPLTLSHEPGAGLSFKILSWFSARLPIEWLL